MKNKLSIPGKSLQSIKKLNLFSHFCLDLFRECYAFPSPIPCDAPLARSSQNSWVLTIWGSIQTCLRLYVFSVGSHAQEDCGPQVESLWLSNLFLSSMCDDFQVAQRQTPTSEGVSCSSTPMLNRGHLLIHSFSQERFIECPLFPKSQSGSTENSICLWPQCTFSLGQCSFS